MKVWLVAGASFLFVGLILVVVFINILGGDGVFRTDETAQQTDTIQISFQAEPPVITPGGEYTIHWSAPEADTCYGIGFETEGKTSGSVPVSPIDTTQYDISCSNASVIEIATTAITRRQQDPSVVLSTSASAVNPGEPVTIMWSSENSPQCSSAQFPTQGAMSGSVVVRPFVTTTYTITCIQPGHSSHDTTRLASDSVTITVP